MKLSSPILPVVATLVSLATAHPSTQALKPRRTKSLLFNAPGIPDLPSEADARAAATGVGLNLDNIQGDVVIGMHKDKELFFFFVINNATFFQDKLQSDIHGLITSTSQILSVSTQPLTAVNLAFSKPGLDVLGVQDDIGDILFDVGQEDTVPAMGDNIDNWVPQFRNRAVHGVFLLASDTEDNIASELANIQSILGNSIEEVYRLAGAARPGNREHFGFVDGISQPALEGFQLPRPGQITIPAGIIIVGADGDPLDQPPSQRPEWAKDGSFLAFRQLQQLVPEFNKFLADNPLDVPGLTPEEGSELLGARMVGRWKSGAPVDLSPLRDDPVLGGDASRNNDFNFTHPDFNFTSDQTHCPFSAHIRKANPRADFPDQTAIIPNHIIRAGIPYGPEVSAEEAASNTTSTERGLAFVSYQSNINSGFFFIQANWLDQPGFIFGKSDPTPGWDPLLGQIAQPSTGPKFASGLDPTDPNKDYTLPDFVVSRGGEYFFSPPVSAITAGMRF